MTEPSKVYRAVPVGPQSPTATASLIIAANDLEAVVQAQRLLGTETYFDLWAGDQLIVKYRPVPIGGTSPKPD